MAKLVVAQTSEEVASLVSAVALAILGVIIVSALLQLWFYRRKKWI